MRGGGTSPAYLESLLKRARTLRRLGLAYPRKRYEVFDDFLVSAESVLHSKSCFWIVPAESFFNTCKNACPAFQASIRIWKHISILIKRVHLCGADEEAVLRLALHAADLLVNSDMPFFVNFEHIAPKFLLYLHDSTPLYLEQIKRVLQR